LGGDLTVTDTGTATTDAMSLTVRRTASGDALNGQKIKNNGYETLTINTAATTAVGAQTIGIIEMNNDSLAAASTLNISGANTLTVAGVTSNSSGLLTIDASALSSLDDPALVMGSAPVFTVATGTVSIKGGVGSDTLRGPTVSSATIDGGAGNDTIIAGTANDSITGGDGNDALTGGGGNDTISGGGGNDTITVDAGTVSVDGGAGNDTVIMGGTLSTGDVVNGGDGTDSLRINATVTAATALGVTNFETLDLRSSFDQGMEQFTNNQGFTRLNFNPGLTNEVTNVGAGVNTVSLANGTTTTVTRLVDQATNTLTIVHSASPDFVTAFTANNERAITVNSGSSPSSSLSFAALSASSLTSLTVQGSANVSLGTITGAGNLATINASALAGTLDVDASASTASGTFTGSFVASSTITGGTGADTITGGVAADRLTGGNGADSINGEAGNDILSGGLGGDLLFGNIGDDTLIGGVGDDTLTGGSGNDIFALQSDNGADIITDFSVGEDKISIGAASGASLITSVGPLSGSLVPAGAGAPSSILLSASDEYLILNLNGASGNFTTASSKSLTTADMTARTLTNLAAYLSDRIVTTGIVNDDALFVINWTAGGSTSTYLYRFADLGNNVVDAAELELVGVVTRDAVLTTSQIIA
jgi:Ca2+-binding RTX toxin-like protein